MPLTRRRKNRYRRVLISIFQVYNTVHRREYMRPSSECVHVNRGLFLALVLQEKSSNTPGSLANLFNLTSFATAKSPKYETHPTRRYDCGKSNNSMHVRTAERHDGALDLARARSACDGCP